MSRELTYQELKLKVAQLEKEIRQLNVRNKIRPKQTTISPQVPPMGDEKLLRIIVEHTPASVVMCDKNMRWLAYSQRCIEDYNLPKKDLTGHYHYEIVPDLPAKWKAEHKRALSGETIRVDQEAFKRRDGRVEWVKREILPWYDAYGDIGGILIFNEIITDRKLAENSIKELQLQQDAILNNIPDLAWLKDSKSRFIAVNESFAKACGLRAENLKAKTDLDIWPSELARAYRSDDFDVMQTGQRKIVEEQLVDASGSIKWIETIKTPIFNKKGKIIGTTGIARDITQRKRAEEENRKLEDQLRHVQKLESLGVLAGGIAHDFNNLLMGVLGNADLALISLEKGSPVRPNIVEIKNAAVRAAELCRQMLAYSGKGKFIVEAVNLSKLVKEMTNMLAVSVSKNALLRYNCSENIPSINADATQMRQVVMNLVINASEAIGGRSGVISVSTGAMECTRAYFSETYIDDQIPEGLYCYVEVADTGVGMDKDTLDKIFDPFFTTKFTGRGLGLAAVFGIVRGHEGAIKIYS